MFWRFDCFKKCESFRQDKTSINHFYGLKINFLELKCFQLFVIEKKSFFIWLNQILIKRFLIFFSICVYVLVDKIVKLSYGKNP